jgi:hypothetical protein
MTPFISIIDPTPAPIAGVIVNGATGGFESDIKYVRLKVASAPRLGGRPPRRRFIR